MKRRTAFAIANPKLDKMLLAQGINLPIQSTRPEDIVQEHLVRWLRAEHPDVLFHANYLSGVKLPFSVANRAKLLGSPRAVPDIEIFEARAPYHGCFLELKAEGIKLLKRNGDWVSPHVQEQAEKLQALRDRGYFAEFAVGFIEARQKVELYLSL